MFTSQCGAMKDTIWRYERHDPAPSVGKAVDMARSKESPQGHGTRAGYVYGCRCQDCKAANTAYMRAYRAREKVVEVNRWMTPSRSSSLSRSA